MSKHRTTVISAVLERYLATGESLTVKDIAAATGLSEPQVRAGIAADDYTMLVHDTDHRTSYSTSYRGWETGYHKVKVFVPARSLLRRIITTHTDSSARAALVASQPTEEALMAALGPCGK